MDANISKRDRIVVPLESQRPWAIRALTGRACARWTNVDITEHLLSIMNDCQMFGDESDIESLPLARRL